MSPKVALNFRSSTALNWFIFTELFPTLVYTGSTVAVTVRYNNINISASRLLNY